MAEHLARKLAVILHADVVGSTRLVQRDETLAHERIRNTFLEFSNTIESYGGLTHELRGDALVAEFDRASDAISASLAFQAGVSESSMNIDDDIVAQLRIGISMGEVVIADNTVTGAGVVLAQRIEQLARPGGVCVQAAAYETAPKRLPYRYKSLGECELKGFDEPVRVYSVTLEDGKPIPPPDRALRSERPELDLPDKPSIAVLPFANMSGDAEQEYFADGVADDLITALSNVQSFFVIARNSTFVYRDQAVDVKQVGRELGVHYVVEGSVRKGGDRLRVNAQLLDATTGKHIWANRYDGGMDDIFDFQDEITASIVGAIEPHLNRAELERVKQKRPENLDAYDFTLRGLAAMNELTPESTAEALELYRKAIAVDPKYARAYACASWCYRRHVQLKGLTLSAEDKVESIRLAHSALKLDQTDPYVLWQAGMTLGFLEHDFDTMTELVDRSLESNSNSVRAWIASGSLRCILGEPERAIEDAERAMRLSPLDTSKWVAYGVLASAHMQKGDYEEAASWARRSVREHPFNLPAYHVLAASCAQTGHPDEARDAIKQLRALDPEITIARLVEIYPVAKYKNLVGFVDGLRKAGLPDE